jgi:small conductance mechanosensitive channel
VGDYVTIGIASGVVEELGMRTTRLKDNSGKLFIIANGDINQVYNHSRGHLWVWTDVPLSAGADLDKAKTVLNAAGQAIADEMPDKIKMPFKCDGLSTIGREKITIRFAGGVVARYQDEVLLTLNERIRDELAQNNIGLG